MKKSSKTILFVALAALGLNSAAGFTVGGLEYSTLSDATVTVKKYIEGTDITIPEKVTDPDSNTEYDVVQIERQAFYNAAIKTLSVPASVKSIEPYAFWKATVETVDFAEGVESIGYGAFRQCTSLTSVKLPESLTVLGSVFTSTGYDGAVFSECTALKTIVIPSGIDSIRQLTFGSCLSLSEVILPEGLTTIDERAFEACASLKELTLPSTITTFGHAAFNKSGIKNPIIPGTVKIIPNSAYLWCQDMTAFTIEEGVEEIGKSAFADCRGFTEITIPNSVEWIRTDAFQGNEHVTKVHIGSGTRRMGHACLALWAPDQETNTPQWALEEIHIDSPVPPVHEQNDDHFDIVDDDFFFGGKEFKEELRKQFYSEVRLYVPESAVEAYREAPVWKNFTHINDKEYNGIDDIMPEGAIRIEDGIVYSDTTIEAYTTAGMRVASASESLDLNALGTGIYIVRSGNRTVKASIR
jgi:hypothetical protein